MLFFHLADLHIGKTLHGFPLGADQEFALAQVLAAVAAEKPAAVILAGDIYDRAAPPAEAVSIADRFLTALARTGTSVLLIAGNHDSPERLGFGGRIMAASRVYIEAQYEGRLRRVALADEWGEVAFYLLPWLRPGMTRRFFPQENITTTEDAVRAVLEREGFTGPARRVLAAHQLVGLDGWDPLRADSERVPLNEERVDIALFAPFTYTALGHLHRAQAVSERVRYAGSLLPYSFGETDRGKKGFLAVELGPPGEAPRVTERPLEPRRPLHVISGTFARLARPETAAEVGDAYLKVTLTDEDFVDDALNRLRSFFPHVAVLQYVNARTQAPAEIYDPPAGETPLALFQSFFRAQNGADLNEAQTEIIRALLAAAEAAPDGEAEPDTDKEATGAAAEMNGAAGEAEA
ncbi:MAG: exonuclease SbcCD subunit D [Gracilibacteraceae bacterium]|jgi:exonuclease SbcD|nr:exonuclease SbcCD subunit D [Gracilibacteraceae bacterium]